MGLRKPEEVEGGNLWEVDLLGKRDLESTGIVLY
jgi:hypothetical protein